MENIVPLNPALRIAETLSFIKKTKTVLILRTY